MNRVKEICDRIIELLPKEYDIQISALFDESSSSNYSLFIQYQFGIEYEVWAEVGYNLTNKEIVVQRINESKYPESVSNELASLGSELIFCYAGELVDYGTYIRKYKDSRYYRNPYYLDICTVGHETAYIADFETDDSEQKTALEEMIRGNPPKNK